MAVVCFVDHTLHGTWAGAGAGKARRRWRWRSRRGGVRGLTMRRRGGAEREQKQGSVAAGGIDEKS